MKVTQQHIKEIANWLDSGLVCYLNPDTLEIKSIMHIEGADFFDEDEDPNKEDLEEIEKWVNVLEIKQMPSNDSFKIMEDFADQLSNSKLKNRLIKALNNRNPFQNFKYELNANEEVRQQWFKYKTDRYQQWLRAHLKALDSKLQIEDN